MSWTLQIDLTDPDWLEMRRKHVVDVVLSYLCGTRADHSVETPRKRRAKSSQAGPA
jgi:hypothetical protein